MRSTHELELAVSQWLTEAERVCAPGAVSIYRVGSFCTPAFTAASDIDLVVVFHDAVDEVRKKNLRKLAALTPELPLELHFISVTELGFDLARPTAYALTCVLSWQGACLAGTEVPFPVAGDEEVRLYHALRLRSGLRKSQEAESARTNQSLFRALAVLDGHVDLARAVSKQGITVSAPATWDLRAARARARQSLARWNLPDGLARELEALLLVDV